MGCEFPSALQSSSFLLVAPPSRSARLCAVYLIKPVGRATLNASASKSWVAARTHRRWEKYAGLPFRVHICLQVCCVHICIAPLCRQSVEDAPFLCRLSPAAAVYIIIFLPWPSAWLFAYGVTVHLFVYPSRSSNRAFVAWSACLPYGGASFFLSGACLW